MSTSAVSSLIARLDAELAWRKQELISIYLDIPHAASTKQSTKSRAALLMLYAHWEGFVKFAFTAYVEEVAKCVSDSREYNDHLLGLSARSWVLNVANQKDPSGIGKLLRLTMERSQPFPKLRTTKIIQTKSNVGPKVLNEILQTVGLEVDRFIEYESTVIKPLVSSRNAIAHGSMAPVVVERFRHFYHRVLDLFEKIRQYLEDSLVNLSYLKPKLNN